MKTMLLFLLTCIPSYVTLSAETDTMAVHNRAKMLADSEIRFLSVKHRSTIANTTCKTIFMLAMIPTSTLIMQNFAQKHPNASSVDLNGFNALIIIFNNFFSFHIGTQIHKLSKSKKEKISYLDELSEKNHNNSLIFTNNELEKYGKELKLNPKEIQICISKRIQEI